MAVDNQLQGLRALVTGGTNTGVKYVIDGGTVPTT